MAQVMLPVRATAMLSLSIALAFSAVPLSAQTMTASGDPGALIVQTATAGSEPAPASDAMTTYVVTTTSANQKIVARLDAPLPNGVTLTFQAAAPAGAASRGPVALTTADQEVVGPVPTPGTYAGLAIVYTLSSTVKAGPVPTSARTVTLSVVAGP
jgi:hypothetical protein